MALLTPNAKTPPPEQLRFFLTRSRTHGVPFDVAWRGALRRIRWPHEKAHRHEWKEAIDETREAWQSAYELREDDPLEHLAECEALELLAA